MANFNSARKSKIVQILEYSIRLIIRFFVLTLINVTNAFNRRDPTIDKYSNFNVFLNGGIGDVLMAYDTIRSIAASGKHIVLIVPIHSAVFFEDLERIEVHAYDNSAGFMANFRGFIKILNRNSGHVFLSFNPRFEVFLLFLLSNVKRGFGFLDHRTVIRGYRVPGALKLTKNSSKHERYSSLHELILDDNSNANCDAHQNKSAVKHNNTLKYVVCAPGKTSLWPAGRWPVDRFAEALIEFCLSKGLSLKIVGTSSEAEACAQLQMLVENKINFENLCNKTTLQELLDVIDGAELILCNDSGVMHMSAVLNKKCVAVFSFSDPKEFAWGRTVKTCFSKTYSCQPCIPNKSGWLGDNIAFKCPYQSRCDLTTQVIEVVHEMEKIYET